MDQQEEFKAFLAVVREAIGDHSSPMRDPGDGHGARGQRGFIVWESSVPFIVAAILRAMAKVAE